MPADVVAFRRPATRKPGAKAQPEVNERTRKPFHSQNPPWKAPVRVQEPPKEWISGEAFKDLERVAAVTFSCQSRDGINDAISLAATMNPVGNDDNSAAAKAKVAEIEKLRRWIARVRQQLRIVEASSIPGQGRTLLELWQEATGIQLSAGFWGPGPEVDRRIATFDRIAAAQAAVLRQRKGTLGSPKRFQHLDTLIWILAETYAREGGVPSAAYRKSGSSAGLREAPFLRMVRFVHQRLPASKQATSMAAFEERVARVVKDMRAFRRKMSFDPWPEARKRKGQKSRGG